MHADFHTRINRYMDEIDWDNLSLQEHCIPLQRVKLDAGREEFGEIPKTRPKPENTNVPKKDKNARTHQKEMGGIGKEEGGLNRYT